jgi:hypothetical protein
MHCISEAYEPGRWKAANEQRQCGQTHAALDALALLKHGQQIQRGLICGREDACRLGKLGIHCSIFPPPCHLPSSTALYSVWTSRTDSGLVPELCLHP